jgi:hypothetical protein
MNVQPAVYNLRISKGEDFSVTFDIDIDGTILDLTGANVFAQVREYEKRTSTKLADFTTEITVGAVTEYPSDITISMSDAISAAIIPNRGYYDILVVDAAGTDTYYIKGLIVFEDTVTVKP